jgi:hypothetical protein
LARIEAKKADWERLGVKVISGSSDPEDRAIEVGRNLSFPVSFGIGEETARALGAYTGVREGRFIIQPTEIILRPGGTVAAALYATLQVGRMDPEEVVRFLNARVGKPAS